MTEAVTDPDTAVAAPAEAPPAEPGLHQPKRWLIAAGEVVAVVLLVVLAIWCWNRGVVRLEYPVDGRDPLISTRYHGNWLGTSVAAATLAVVLVLDAVRQIMLAVRTRPQEAPDSDM